MYAKLPRPEVILDPFCEYDLSGYRVLCPPLEIGHGDIVSMLIVYTIAQVRSLAELIAVDYFFKKNRIFSKTLFSTSSVLRVSFANECW